MSDKVLQNNTPKKAAFLAAYAETGTVLGASKATGVGRMSHYRWMEVDPEYRERFNEAHQQACEMLEEEARRRAIQGVRKLKFDPKTGEPYKDPETNEPYQELTYSDVLLIFLLKGAMPDKYRDRVENHHSGNVGVEHSGHITIQQVVEEIEQNDDYVEFARQRAGASGQDSDAGDLCPTNGNGKVDIRGAPAGDRPGGDGHDSGQDGTDPGD